MDAERTKRNFPPKSSKNRKKRKNSPGNTLNQQHYGRCFSTTVHCSTDVVGLKMDTDAGDDVISKGLEGTLLEDKVLDGTLTVDDGPLTVDKSKLRVYESTLRVDDSTLIIDDSTLRVDESTLRVDESTLRVDESTLRVDESTLRIDESTLRVDESTLRVDESTLRVDESTLRVDESTPVVDQSSPTQDEGSMMGTDADDSDSSERDSAKKKKTFMSLYKLDFNFLKKVFRAGSPDILINAIVQRYNKNTKGNKSNSNKMCYEFIASPIDLISTSLCVKVYCKNSSYKSVLEMDISTSQSAIFLYKSKPHTIFAVCIGHGGELVNWCVDTHFTEKIAMRILSKDGIYSCTKNTLYGTVRVEKFTYSTPTFDPFYFSVGSIITEYEGKVRADSSIYNLDCFKAFYLKYNPCELFKDVSKGGIRVKIGLWRIRLLFPLQLDHIGPLMDFLMCIDAGEETLSHPEREKESDCMSFKRKFNIASEVYTGTHPLAGGLETHPGPFGTFRLCPL